VAASAAFDKSTHRQSANNDMMLATCFTDIPPYRISLGGGIRSGSLKSLKALG
jgi:hypothetical protein